MNICVYGAAGDSIDPKYIAAGQCLGTEMAKAGYGLVFGGGARGMMGAVARGVYAGGGYILGVAPTFFDGPGIYFPHCTDFKSTDTMRERKQFMEEQSDAFIMTPGGLGTWDEFIEILSLRALGRHQKPIAVLNTDGFFDPMLAWMRRAVEERFIDADRFDMFFVSDSPAQIIAYITANRK